MARMDLSLLGPFRLKLNGEGIASAVSDNARALLAYLAVEADHPHRREQLAALLWPDRPESDARHSLRQSLYELRKTLGDQQTPKPVIRLDRRQVQFDRSADSRLDVTEFESLISTCRGHHARSRLLCTECRQCLELAVELYQGEFLAGFSLPGSPHIEAWQLTQREHYHRQVIEALFQLGEHCESLGEYDQAAGCARRVLDLEPWRESAHRRLMRALALDGREGEALRQYAVCKDVLDLELGVPSAPQTEQLAALIRAGELRSNMPAKGATTYPVPGHDVDGDELADTGSPFVAREAEVASLHSHLKSALSGKGGVVFVRGEPGSGKTALLAEFARQAAQRHSDVVIAAGSCSALAGQGDTCQPFREVLSALTADFENGMDQGVLSAHQRQRLWASFPAALAAVVELAPDLLGAWMPVEPLVRRARMVSGLDPHLHAQLNSLSGLLGHEDDAPIADRTDSGQGMQASIGLPPPSQGAIFEQFSRVLFTIASERPLVLLLDDLQWADPCTCSLLFHLGRHMADSRILIVGAYRAEDLIQDEGHHHLRTVIHELQVQYGDIVIDLAEADHRAFVDAYLDEKPNRLDAGFRETLYRRTEGHPLFTVELLRNLQSGEGLVQERDGTWVATAILNWANVPPRVEAVIGERVERVPSVDRHLLSAASVLGEVFCAEVLADVLGKDPLEVTRTLSELLGRQYRLVQSYGERVMGRRRLSRYRFRNHLFRQYLYHRLDSATKAQLHQATAEVLQNWRRTQGDREPVRETSAARLAWHFEQAGMVQESIPYLLEAGQDAYRLSASDQAIIHLNRGLELLEHVLHTRERDMLEYSLQAALGQPLLTLYGYAAEQQAYGRAAELAKKLDEPDLLAPVMFLQFCYYFLRGEYGEAEEITGRVFTVAKRTQDPQHDLQANYQASQLCLLGGRLPKARSHLDSVLATLDKVPDDQSVLHSGNLGRIQTANQAGAVLWLQGYPDQALDYAWLALEEAEKLGHAYWLTLTQTSSMCHVYLLRKDGIQVQEISESALRVAQDRGFSVIEMIARIYRSCAQVELGNPHDGLAQLEEILSLYHASGHRFFVTLYMAYLAKAYGMTGDITRGLDVVAQALALTDEGDHLYEAELRRVRGELLLASNEEVLAETAYQRAVQVANKQEAHSLHLRATVSLARLWQRQDRQAEAHQVLAQAYSWFSEGFDTVDLLQAKTLLNELTPPPQ